MDKEQLIAAIRKHIESNPQDYADLELAMRQAKSRAEQKQSKFALWLEEVKAQGYVDGIQARELLGLSSREFGYAIQRGYISNQKEYGVMTKFRYYHPDRLKLSPEQLQDIKLNTLHNRSQAAEYLGIGISKFNKLVREHGIKHDDTFPGYSGNGYLWKQSTLDQLKPFIKVKAKKA